MSAITERQADECVPAGDGERDASRPTIDAFGELMRRATKAPLSFGFVWHGMNFTGALEAIDGGMRLSLQSNLAQLPYSAEDAKSRGDLLAVVDILDGKTDGLLKVSRDRRLFSKMRFPCHVRQPAALVRWSPIWRCWC